MFKGARAPAAGDTLLGRGMLILNIRMVAIDVDGTLVGEDDRVPPENSRAVRETMAAGVRVVLATGRAYEGVRRLVGELGLTDPLVLLGGSIVQGAGGEVMKSFPMSPNQVTRVYEFCRTRGLSVRAQTAHASYLLFRDLSHPDVELMQKRLMEWAPYDYAFVYDYGSMPTRGVNKVTIMFDTPEQMWRLRPELNSSLAGMTCVQAFRNWIEITAGRTSKLRGVRFVARMMGVGRHEIAAIGDNENDLDLVGWAGVGILAGTAHEAWKSAARVLAPPGEPVVAWGLAYLAGV